MLYDVDTLAAEFEPTEVRFRGAQYRLGDTVEQVLGAVAEAGKVPDDAPLIEQSKTLPPILAALNSELGEVVGDGSTLTLGERLVFQKVVQEAMGRISRVPFHSVTEGAAASLTGGEVPALLPTV